MTKKAILITGIGVFVGAIAGYLYYFYVGCASGTCAITSKPLNSTLYGAVMGGLLFNMFIKSPKKLNIFNQLNSKIMKKNMGSADKISRIIFAIVIGILYFTKAIEGTAALVLGALAVIFLITSFISFCPLYVPFGISTCKKKE